MMGNQKMMTVMTIIRIIMVSGNENGCGVDFAVTLLPLLGSSFSVPLLLPEQ